MLIACKYEEMYVPEANDFVFITDQAYEAKEILAKELEIMKALGFNLGKPIALNFLRRNSKAGYVDVKHHSLAKYILEGPPVRYLSPSKYFRPARLYRPCGPTTSGFIPDTLSRNFPRLSRHCCVPSPGSHLQVQGRLRQIQ